jgi:hypothetical protein
MDVHADKEYSLVLDVSHVRSDYMKLLAAAGLVETVKCKDVTFIS